MNVDKSWVRDATEGALGAIYGLKDPSAEEVESMVGRAFGGSPVLQFPGFRELNPLFGLVQGTENVKEHLKGFYDAVEVVRFEKQFIVVDGFGASAHYEAEFRMKGSGSVFECELVALVDLDMEGRVRALKLYFDTASFLKAFGTPNSRFSDAREELAHPAFDPESKVYAGAVQSNVYNTFLKVGAGQATWDEFWSLWADDMETVFKSNVDLLPYAGRYSGKEGFQQWIQDLFSIWSLNSFNFTETYAEGNQADFAMHELHYYTNPDGSKRYLDVYIVQSWRADESGKIHLFKSYNDSAWLDETYKASEVYKTHYGYPEDYASGEELRGRVPATSAR